MSSGIVLDDEHSLVYQLLNGLCLIGTGNLVDNEIDSMNPHWQTEECIQQSYVIQIQKNICIVDYYLHPAIPTLIVHGLR